MEIEYLVKEQVLITIANHQKIEWCLKDSPIWNSIIDENNGSYAFSIETILKSEGITFRLAPKTFKINGEVLPSPEQIPPYNGQTIFVLDSSNLCGYESYTWYEYNSPVPKYWWNNEENIKKVVEALGISIGVEQNG